MQSLIDTPAPLILRPAECDIFKAPERFSTYDWALKNMRIVAGPSKGHPWNPAVSPVAKGIMDAADDERIRKIFCIAPSQSTKTTIAYAIILAQLCRMLDTIGVGMPDELAAYRVFTGLIHKYVQNIPALRKLLAENSPLNNYEIRFRDGSSLFAMWAGSEARMRSMSMSYVLIDEEDAYADKSAVQTMEERVTAYERRGMSKIIRISRPKGNEDASNIWNDARAEAHAWMMYEAVCPVCKHGQIMDFKRIRTQSGTRDSKVILRDKLARYECAECGFMWTDEARDMALRAGRWVAVRGDEKNATVVAFHWRSWESPQVSMSSVLAKWFDAQGDPRKLQQFDNNECAKPYKFISVKADHEELRRHVLAELPPAVVPDDAVCLTLAADMQKGHFVYSVAAHAAGPERIWIVDYGTLQTWDELTAQVFAARYTTLDGRELGIWRAALDTGGTRHEGEEESRPMQAYRWLLAQRPGVVFGTKGMSRKTPGVFVKAALVDTDPLGRKLKSGLRLIHLNPDAFKALAFWRLAEGAEEEPIFFHSETGDDYLKQIASEQLEKDKNGNEIWRRFRANHYLDCLVQHLAMAHWQWKPSLAQMIAGMQQPAAAPAMRHAQRINPYTGGVSLFGQE